jgi:RNA polymerase sigma factor (sigma-70 family)
VSNVGTTNLTARATHSEDPPGKQAGRILAGPARAAAGKSDEALVKLAKLGDEGAIATLYERYSAAILRYCCSILRSQQEAEDIQQEVFLHAIAALRHGPGPISFRPWLYRVAHNACISHLRSRKPTVVVEDASLAGAATEPETENREELRQLLADISRLSPVQRGALLLREMDGFSYEQIATALELPLTTVRSTIFRARATLQGMAEARDADCEAIQAELSEMADRRGRRSRRITSHLRVCNQCREFREGLRYRPSTLGECAPSRLNVLRNTKVAAVVAALVAAVAAGLHALGALGSSPHATPATAQRHRLTAPLAPAVTPRAITIPAHSHHRAATRGAVHLRPEPASGAASSSRAEDTRGVAGRAPATPKRRGAGVERPFATISPHAGGDAIPLPQAPAPHSGSGSSPTPSTGSGSSSSSSGAAAPSAGSGSSSSTGSAGSGDSSASGSPAPNDSPPPSAGGGDGSSATGDGSSSGSHTTDPSSPDRPQVTHNDSTADPGASGAVGVGADTPAVGSGDASSASQSPPSPPPAVTGNAAATTP